MCGCVGRGRVNHTLGRLRSTAKESNETKDHTVQDNQKHRPFARQSTSECARIAGTRHAPPSHHFSGRV
eukprot:scaffold155_cov347-Pavlova_lutheri.AAC.103